MTDFRDYAEDLAPKGGWLSDASSKAYLRALGGAASDGLVIWRDSRRARFASTAPADALGYIGDNRQIEQAPREDEDAYRARLRRCFEIHEARGTKDAYREVLGALGVPGASVYVYNNYEVGLADWWSYIWIAVDSTAGPWTEAGQFDTGLTLDAGVMLDITGLNEDEIHYIRRTIRRWKWAGAYPLVMGIVLAGQAFDMGLTMDAALTLDSGTLKTALLKLGEAWDQESALYGYPPIKMDTGLHLDPAFPE